MRDHKRDYQRKLARKEVAMYFKSVREYLGLDTCQFSEILGLGHSEYMKYEKGKKYEEDAEYLKSYVIYLCKCYRESKGKLNFENKRINRGKYIRYLYDLGKNDVQIATRLNMDIYEVRSYFEEKELDVELYNISVSV